MSAQQSPLAARLHTVRWLDPRLIAGVVLILLSAALGAKVFADASRSEPVWAVTRSLPAGATLRSDDVEAKPVRIKGGASRYLAAYQPPAGFVLSRPVGAGELLPRSALASPRKRAVRRLVTVPVERFHFPAGLRAGEVVDVYSVVGGASGAHDSGRGASSPVAVPRQVLDGVVVDAIDATAGQLGASGSRVGVSLAVRPEDVADVVAAGHDGAIDLVRVPQSTP
jgi:hypothetical protein